uniref:Uncharacterized protein n=1 Tax=Arundo donax TaxID=35708 RepID=A0A0A9CPJ8_ARUDO
MPANAERVRNQSKQVRTQKISCSAGPKVHLFTLTRPTVSDTHRIVSDACRRADTHRRGKKFLDARVPKTQPICHHNGSQLSSCWYHLHYITTGLCFFFWYFVSEFTKQAEGAFETLMMLL